MHCYNGRCDDRGVFFNNHYIEIVSNNPKMLECNNRYHEIEGNNPKMLESSR